MYVSLALIASALCGRAIASHDWMFVLGYALLALVGLDGVLARAVPAVCRRWLGR